MELQSLKWLASVILFTASWVVAFGTVSLVAGLRLNPNGRVGRTASIIGLLNCFAGGVFMATGLLDIFPEVNKAIKTTWNHGYPVAEFMVAVGFFLVLTVEQIVLVIKESSQAIPSERDDSTDPLVTPSDHSDVRPGYGSVVGVSDHPLVSSTNSGGSQNGSEVVEGDPHSSLRTVLMAAALSLHSVFEGLAIGLQSDSITLMQICLGVFLHKTVIAISLGLNLADSRLTKYTVLTVINIFSLASTVGIALAIGLEEFGHSLSSSPLNGILQGIACGTFFYVTFFEVLPHELNLGGNRMLKVLAIMLGFSLISGLLFLEPDNRAVQPSPTDSSSVTYMLYQ